ncbi:MAG: glycosyl hydrolase family 28-related protein, partial [Tepidisphaerales bacterium]
MNYLRALPWAATVFVILGATTFTWAQPTAKPYITVGDSGYGSSMNDLSAAVKAIGATPCTLVVPQGATCAGGGVTIPATCNLRVANGATITVADGTQFLINGPFETGEYQVFRCIGSGNVHFGARSIPRCLTAWWGSDPTGTKDNAAIFNAAIASVHNEKSQAPACYEVYSGPGTYKIGSRVLLRKVINFRGDTSANTAFKADAGFPASKTPHGYGLFWYGGQAPSTACYMPPILSHCTIDMEALPLQTEYVGLWYHDDGNRATVKDVIFSTELYSALGPPRPYNKHIGIRMSAMPHQEDGTPNATRVTGEAVGTGDGTTGPYSKKLAHAPGADVYTVVHAGAQTITSDGFQEWLGQETPTGVYGAIQEGVLNIAFPSPVPAGTPITVDYYWKWIHTNHDSSVFDNLRFRCFSSPYGAVCIEPNADANTMVWKNIDFYACNVNFYSAAYISTYENVGNEPASDQWQWGDGNKQGHWSCQNVFFGYDGPSAFFGNNYYEGEGSMCFWLRTENNGYGSGIPLLLVEGLMGGGFHPESIIHTCGGHGYQVARAGDTTFTMSGNRAGLCIPGTAWVIMETLSRNRYVYFVSAAKYDDPTRKTTFTVDPTKKRTASWTLPPAPLPADIIGIRVLAYNDDYYQILDGSVKGGNRLKNLTVSTLTVGSGLPNAPSRSPVGSGVSQLLAGSAEVAMGTLAAGETHDYSFALKPDLSLESWASVSPASKLQFPGPKRGNSLWRHGITCDFTFRLLGTNPEARMPSSVEVSDPCAVQ